MIRITSTREDYLEMLYLLIKEKGYATTVDMANHLHVKSPAVTMMMKKLDVEGFVEYEKYRGVTLTSKGEKVAKLIVNRHRIISKFLRILGVKKEIVQKDIEAIEHVIDEETIYCITQFLNFAKDHPEWTEKYPPFKKNYKDIFESENEKLNIFDLKYAHKMHKISKKRTEFI